MEVMRAAGGRLTRSRGSLSDTMKIVPSSLIRGLYEQGSLSRIQNGFTFEMENPKGVGVTLDRVLPLEVDGEVWPVEGMSFVVDGRTTKAENVSGRQPFHVPAGGKVMVQVMGLVLDDQPHRVVLPVEARGLGRLELSFRDVMGQGAKQEKKN